MKTDKLPSNWQAKKLKDIISDKISGEWGTEAFSDDSPTVNVIRTTNFSNNGQVNLDNVVQRNIPLKKVQQKQLQYGDTIIEKSGGSPNQPVGRVVFFKEHEGTYLCNNFTSVLRAKKNVDPQYLFWALFHSYQLGIPVKYQNKTTGIINLKLDNYLDESIPLPPLETQRRIAAVLEKADHLRSLRRQALARLDDLVQSVFLEMFGDPVTNPMGWEVTKLGKAFSLKPQIGTTTPAHEGGHYKVVRVGEIGEYNVKLQKSKSVTLSKQDFEKFALGSGDILLARAIGSESHLGKASIFLNPEKKVVFDSHVMRLRFNPEKINYLFFYHWLNSKGGRNRFMRKAGRTAVQFNINSKQISDIDIPLPPIELQKQFVLKLSKLNTLASDLSQTNLFFDNLFNSLMQKAFKGELQFAEAEQSFKQLELSF